MADPKILGNALYQILVQFPHSALTIPRQPHSKPVVMPHADDSKRSKYEISQTLYDLCRSPKSISALLAEDPHLTPGDAWKQLYHHTIPHLHESKETRDIGKGTVDDAELLRAKECGKWGESEPSELFLRVNTHQDSFKSHIRTIY